MPTSPSSLHWKSTLGLVLGLALVAGLLIHRSAGSRALPLHPAGNEPTPAKSTLTQVPASHASNAAPSTSSLPGAPRLDHSAKTRTLAIVHAGLKRLMLRQTGDDQTRDEVMTELLALLTDDDAGDIVSSLNGQELQTEFGTAALVRWLGTDPDRSAAWLAAHGGPTGEQAAIIGRRLVATPAALTTLCDVLPEGALKQAVLTGAALQAADRDPRTAITLANRLPAGSDQTGIFETVAYAWAVADPVAAGKWIEAVPDASLRQRLLAVGAKALATTDPDLAASWLTSAVQSGAILSDTALTIVDAWSAKDPAAAAAWVGGFPANSPRQEAIQLVLQHWLKSNPDAANAWLTLLPDRAKVVAQLEANAAENAEPKD